MTQEEKQLLLKDLCARLVYGVVVNAQYKDGEGWKTEDRKLLGLYTDGQVYVDAVYTNIENIKPYLRPMSSMTEEEIKEAENISRLKYIDGTFAELRQFTLINDNFVDWLNSHHFDYRGLIEKGLALEAPESTKYFIQ